MYDSVLKEQYLPSMKGLNLLYEGLNVMLFSDFKADIQYKLTHNRKKELIF